MHTHAHTRCQGHFDNNWSTHYIEALSLSFLRRYVHCQWCALQQNVLYRPMLPSSLCLYYILCYLIAKTVSHYNLIMITCRTSVCQSIEKSLIHWCRLTRDRDTLGIGCIHSKDGDHMHLHTLAYHEAQTYLSEFLQVVRVWFNASGMLTMLDVTWLLIG